MLFVTLLNGEDGGGLVKVCRVRVIWMEYLLMVALGIEVVDDWCDQEPTYA